MTWPSSIVIGLVAGAVSAALAMFAADRGMGWHGVSDFEGKRGMMMVFIFGPAGFAVGAVAGILVARGRMPGTAGAAAGALGLSLAISTALVAAGLGAAWLSADHAPTIEGRALGLEYEIRLPPGFPVRDSLESAEFRVGLVASGRDRAFTRVDFDNVRTVDSFVIVSGRGDIRSTRQRSLSVNHGSFAESRPSQFVDLPLAPRPGKEDFEWSPWLTMSRRMDLSQVPASERAQVRYRVRFADDTPPR